MTYDKLKIIFNLAIIIISIFISMISITSCSTVNVARQSNNNDISDGTNIVDIAILLPFTKNEDVKSTNADINTRLMEEYEKMIKMGIKHFAKTKIRVTTYDCGNKKSLNQSINKIIKKNIHIVIGPIYSEDTKIVAQTFDTKKHDAIIFSLSNDEDIAKNNIFVLGHRPVKQLEYLIQYLLKDNYKNYVLLMPEGGHSYNISQIIQKMIVNADANIAKIEFYSDDIKSINKAVKSISYIVDNLNEIDFNIKRPIIILADNMSKNEFLLNEMIKYKLDKKAFITGDNRIDTSNTQNISLICTSSQNLKSNIIGEAGINHANFMHKLAYDAGYIVSESIGKAYDSEKFLENLHNNKFTESISSKILYFENQIATRKYNIIKRVEM